MKLASATIGESYDRALINVNSAVGNERLGVYNSEGTPKPNSLKSESSSIASQAGQNWRSLTEFEIDTVQMWLAFQVDNAGNSLFLSNTGNTFDKYTYVKSYGVFDATFADTSHDQDVVNGKIGHS